MVAGRGVTHSERTSDETRTKRNKLFGIQTWIALPEAHEDMAPDFEHHKQGALPHIQDAGVSARLILGSAYGETSPVTMLSETFYLDVQLDPGASFPLPDDHEDRGVYVTEGSVEIAGDSFEAGRMMVFRPGDHPLGQGRTAWRAPDAAGRRDAERRSLYLVEFRVLLERGRSKPPPANGKPPIGPTGPSICRPVTIRNSSRSRKSWSAPAHGAPASDLTSRWLSCAQPGDPFGQWRDHHEDRHRGVQAASAVIVAHC